MPIDISQLTMNVNLHSLQPDFLNSELHYVLAIDENNFRFAGWEELAQAGETRFYCFLKEQTLVIPAGNITLEESYVLSEEPIYPPIKNCYDFIDAVDAISTTGSGKYIRQFTDDDIDDFKNDLKEKFGTVQKHVVKSDQGQHLLLVFDSSEVSISAAMVYLRHKAPFSDKHYQHVKEE